MSLSLSHRSASLYVGDLADDVTEATLFEIFNAVGPVLSIRVCRDSISRCSLGYAFVNYLSMEDAERALDTLNFLKVNGKACRLMWYQCDASLRKSGVGNIFVKNLDESVDNKTLYDTFSMFGNIHSCKVAINEKDESLGYGFVHYTDESSAKNAIQKVNGMVIAEKKVEVAPFKKKEARIMEAENEFKNIYVKHFQLDVTEEELKELLLPFGEIISFYAPKNQLGKLLGYAFCNYKTHESAVEAVETLHKKLWKNQMLYAARHKKKGERRKEMEINIQKHQGYSIENRINLHVKNLNSTVSEERLRILFSPYGTIRSCKIKNDEFGNSKGFGFVCFEKPDQASKALANLNSQIIDGKPIYVAMFLPKAIRQAQLRTRYNQNSNFMGPSYPPNQPQMTMNNLPQMPMQGQYNNSMQQPRPNFGGYPNSMNYTQPQMQPQKQGQYNNSMQQPRPNFEGYPNSMNYTQPQMQAPQPQMLAMKAKESWASSTWSSADSMDVDHDYTQMQAQFPAAPRMTLKKSWPSSFSNPNFSQNPNKMSPPLPSHLNKPLNYKAESITNAPYLDHPNHFPQKTVVFSRLPPPAKIPYCRESIEDNVNIHKNVYTPRQFLPVSAMEFANKSDSEQKQIIGEKIFPKIKALTPEFAGKITGMLLEMENTELLYLSENHNQLLVKVNEALSALNSDQMKPEIIQCE